MTSALLPARGSRDLSRPDMKCQNAPMARGSHQVALAERHGVRRPVVVGREAEIALVQSFVRAPANGGSSLLFGGDPGIGKSTIFNEAVAAAENTAFLRARGIPYETDIPLSGLNELLLPLQNVVDRLDPDLAQQLDAALGMGGETAVTRDHIVTAVLGLLTEVCGATPLTIFIDDLHLMDHASLNIVQAITAHGGTTGVRVLATYRLGADFEFGGMHTTACELLPLAKDDTEQLLSAHFPSLSSHTRQRLVQQSGGNPLVLLELAKTVTADDPTTPVPRPELLPLTPRLRALYNATISELPDSARQVLLLAALSNVDDIDTLRAAVPDRDVLAEVSAAAAARLVCVDANQRITFVHPIIRSSVVAVSTTAERSAAHRALALALDGQPDQQLWHLADAAREPDEAIAKLLELRAGCWRERGDVKAAVSALYRSAELSPGRESKVRRQALATYLDAQVTGEATRVSSQLVTSRVDMRLGTSAALQSAIAAAYVAFDEDANVDFAHRTLIVAVADALASTDRNDVLIIEAVEILLTVCKYGGRPELWGPFYAIIDRRDLPAAPMLRLRTATMADPARATAADVEALDELIRTLPRVQDPTRLSRIGAACHYVDRVRYCRTELLRAAERARAEGAPGAALYALIPVCLDDIRTGRWDDAEALVAEAIALGESNGYHLFSLLQLATAWLAACRGDQATVREVTGAVLKWAAHSGAEGSRRFAHHVLAISALGQGDWDDAYAHASVVSAPGVLEPNVGHALWAALDMVESAFRAGHFADAAAHVAALRAANVAALSARLALVVAASNAMVAPSEEFEALYEEALALSGVGEWPMELGRIELLFGERLRRERAISKARLHLRRAVEIFTALGAHQWIARAEAELNAAEAPQHAAPRGPALTPQEYRVASLAAKGMTNKQIASRLSLSHRTVSTHLEQVFAKLAIMSRSALPEALAHNPSTTEART
ncbi:MAG: AAA family ATPase [Mycobacterium sp.]